MSTTILVDDSDAIGRITLNRPEVLNALDVEMANAFLAACRRLVQAPQVRVIVVQGSGRAFMAGGDIAAMRADPENVADQLISAMHAGLQLLANGPAPVIASLQGAVAGAGVSLALAADFAVAAEDVRFNLAYANIGASCDLGASWSLPRVVGLRRALEIAMLCPTIDARQAADWGMVNEVVPAGALATTVDSLAQRLASGPTIALGEIRKLLRNSQHTPFEQQLDAERAAFLHCAATADFAEGTQAFVDKRKARFAGR
ncbi:MAG TPA: enoyl-CoA hydratase-related protein [Burkholderiaceae bacterium]|nr:enoyl-CoA hydratase-related protein [Burkholderiaceae bacterium]